MGDEERQQLERSLTAPFLCLQGGEQMAMRKLKKYVPTRFKAKKSVYDKVSGRQASDVSWSNADAEHGD